MKAFILLLLSLYLVYSQPVQRLEEYTASLATWRKLNPKSYQYVVGEYTYYHEPVTKTTITVKNGKVIKRNYWFKDVLYTDEITTWVEDTPETIATHLEGFPALNFDEIYSQCRSNVLIHEPDRIQFEIGNNGLISLCGILPPGCSDGCFGGIKVESFTIL